MMNPTIALTIRKLTGRTARVQLVAAIAMCAILTSGSLWGQTGGENPTSPTVEAPAARDELALEQSQVSDKFSRLEKLILRMAEYDTGQNPRRAALLQKAIALTKEKHVRLQMETVVKLLNEDKLKRATDNQEQVQQDLAALLKLLMSEDRSDQLNDQRKRYLNYIKEIERILRLQRDVQGRTEGGVDEKRLAESQQRVADRTAKLDSNIAENEGQGSEDEGAAAGQSEDSDAEDQDSPSRDAADGQSGKPQNGGSESEQGKDSGADKKDSGADKEESDSEKDKADGTDADKEKEAKESQDREADGTDKADEKQGASDGAKDGKPNEEGSVPSDSDGESESQDGESQDGEPQNSDAQQNGSGQPGQPGEPSDGESPRGESQPSGQPSDELPARKRLQEAERRMREAQQRLEEARREEAAEAQEQARQQLEAAKAELEEILRQMREEEIERTLALLESRFRKMLEMQLNVYENTMRLDKIPLERRDRLVDLEATKLSFQERRIVIEAEKCLTLLQEEGSSVAFPESVEQLRDDMEQVVERLAQAKIGRITQGIEEDIIEALDEMVEALQQAQMDQDQRREQPPGQPPEGMTDEDQPLVDSIAELKMLKALQIRINKRTTRYARLLDNIDDPAGQATDDELISALQRLAEREARLHGITRDIVMGINE